MVWQKAKQYKNKKGNDASCTALSLAVGLVKDKCPLVIQSVSQSVGQSVSRSVSQSVRM